MVITGALCLGGGIAGVNRLALHSFQDAGFGVEVFSLLESAALQNDRFMDSTQLVYRVFHGQKVRFISHVWRSVLTRNYDHVYVDHVNLSALLAPLGALGLCHYSVWLFGIESWPPRPGISGACGARMACKRLSISDFTARKFAERFPHLSVQICELALDPVLHDPVRELLLDIDNDPLVLSAISGTSYPLGRAMILHVARMNASERYKGQDVLIQAMPEILAEHPHSQLVLVGSGDDKPRLLELAVSMPEAVRQAVFFPGFVSDAQLDRLYRQCAVFAMPSRGEGFGLTYIEAMARGKPCVGGRQDAAQCVIRHGQTGLLVDDPTDTQEVAEAIRQLLSNPVSAREMGRAGYCLVQERYLYPHFRSRFLKCLGLENP